MKRIQLHDKIFRLYMPHEDIQTAVKNVANKINNDLKDADTPLFIGVLTGSFMFLSDLMKNIEIPCEICFIRLASYEGTSSTGKVKQLLGLTQNVKNRTVVVVEDIVDTGGTITELDAILKDAGAKDIKYCTLLFKPDNYKGHINVQYPALQIPRDFIVGYGLDYDQLGRQYKDIYVLDEDETERRKSTNVR